MADRIVSAPVEGFTGVVAGVPFADGRAVVAQDNRAALSYFRQAGYRIEAAAEPSPVPAATPVKQAAKRARKRP